MTAKDEHILTPAFSSPVLQVSLYRRVDGAKVSHTDALYLSLLYDLYNFVSLALLHIHYMASTLDGLALLYIVTSPLHYLPSLHLHVTISQVFHSCVGETDHAYLAENGTVRSTTAIVLLAS